MYLDKYNIYLKNVHAISTNELRTIIEKKATISNIYINMQRKILNFMSSNSICRKIRRFDIVDNYTNFNNSLNSTVYKTNIVEPS